MPVWFEPIPLLECESFFYRKSSGHHVLMLSVDTEQAAGSRLKTFGT
jgi:hypothetical protein